MSNRQELEREIAGMSDLIAGLGGTAPITGPDPKTVRESLIAKRDELKSQLRALDD